MYLYKLFQYLKYKCQLRFPSHICHPQGILYNMHAATSNSSIGRRWHAHCSTQTSPASQQVQLQLAAGEFRATKNKNRHNKTATQNEALNFGKFTRSITIGYIYYIYSAYIHIIPTELWQLNSRAHYVPHTLTHTHPQGKTPPTKQQQVTKLHVSFLLNLP